MLKNDKLKKPVGASDRTGFSKILIKKVLPVFLLTVFLFSPLNINKINAQILETDEKTESLEFDKYDDLLEYTENTKTKEVIYNYKTNIVEQQTFNNLNENIDKRKEDVEFYINPNTGKEYAKIYSSKQYRKIQKDWYKFETATTTENNFFMELEKTVPVENFFDKMISLFEFKQTIAQTEYLNSGSGRVLSDRTSSSWDTVHDDESGTNAYVNRTSEILGCWYRLSDNRWIIQRGFLNFDTSFLEIGDVVESASIFVKPAVIYKSDNDEYSYTVVLNSTHTATTTLSTSDYSRAGNTEYSNQITLDNQTTSSYTEFELNAGGISSINFDGYSKFSIKEGHDYEDAAINGTQSTYNGADYYFNPTDTTDDIYILITLGQITTTTADLYPCEIPENTLIQRFTGCENIYTTSTTTPNEIRFFYYDIPLILFLVFFIFSVTPVIIILIFIYVRKKR
ncbi:MAG: hypothetical protein EHM44_02165 [Ignavibacteriales bacterium]|nr:MAG: hypothetical protein EHM44_02165 [Ignavibacteriales bacterium]